MHCATVCSVTLWEYGMASLDRGGRDGACSLWMNLLRILLLNSKMSLLGMCKLRFSKVHDLIDFGLVLRTEMIAPLYPNKIKQKIKPSQAPSSSICQILPSKYGGIRTS